MKKNLITLFLILILGDIWANPIDKETARIVATNFMSNKVGNTLIVKNVISEDLNGQIAFYVVNFQTGGWVMVSADNSAVPVLCYNPYGEYTLEDEKPEAFLELTTSYKEQIANSKTLKSSNIELSSTWETLISGNNLKSLKTYIPGDQLLDVPGRGHVQWRQGSNNSGGCTPSYNAFCPDKGCDDYCDENALVGCGAVAMGQIMWYWQWPQSSSYRTYNWGLMPNVLTNSSSTPEGDEVANLLRDIGREDAADMTYWCSGTWTTVNKIEEAFKDKFNYKGVKKNMSKTIGNTEVLGVIYCVLKLIMKDLCFIVAIKVTLVLQNIFLYWMDMTQQTQIFFGLTLDMEDRIIIIQDITLMI